MSDRFTTHTGVPMVDFLFSGYALMLDMQRKALGAARLPVPQTAGNFVRRQEKPENRVGATEQQIIPLTREELRIGKRQVQSQKAYRVSSTVVEVPVEQQINLRAETVVIERRPATGTIVRGGQTFENKTIEVHEMYEEPVVGKVVTQPEEIVIYKTLSQRTETIHDTVRETRVNVEEQEDKSQPQPDAVAKFNSQFQAAADAKSRQLTVVEGNQKNPEGDQHKSADQNKPKDQPAP